MLFASAAVEGTPSVHPAMVLPFGLLLLLIAVAPLLFGSWWHHHYPKVAIGLGAIVVAYYLGVLHAGLRLVHVLHEYISFIALIGSLFVVAGGIHIQIHGKSRPLGNTLFLLGGAVLANFIGTTGASMLLVRPWIRMNKYRVTAFHVVFFIFIVSNAGGALTPIGDPPLFLGFLKGVPFFWVLQHCWPAWLITIGLLLMVFYFFDLRSHRRAPAEVSADTGPETGWEFRGGLNLVFLLVILGAVMGNKFLPPFVPDFLMVGAAATSYFTTARAIHQANDFNFAPIQEVAWLFAGIFATMVPALDYLEANASRLGLHSAMQFYWATGSLSAFLDNAPTYLTFLAAAMGDKSLSVNTPEHVLAFATNHPQSLAAISLGAVFFGACTYIGNGPNFMVKNIADQMRVRTPSFFGYMLGFAVPILLPVYGIIAILFFSPWRIF
jgi:Na+/H+ antiporter NhaD/arsenite permease-like protein